MLYRISQNKWFERGSLYAQKLNRKGKKGFRCSRLLILERIEMKFENDSVDIIEILKKRILKSVERREGLNVD